MTPNARQLASLLCWKSRETGLFSIKSLAANLPFGTEGWGFESLRVYSTYVDSSFEVYPEFWVHFFSA